MSEHTTEFAQYGTRARRRFERRTGIDLRGVDKRVARRIMRRFSPAYLAYQIERDRRTPHGQTGGAR